MQTPDSGDPRSDDDAWAEVVRRWGDDDAHREFLSRLTDLHRLAEAGRRYKAVLGERPDDAVAQRWRDEVLRRATALAFAQLPRTAPPSESSSKLRRLALGGVVLAFVVAIAWLGLRLASLPVGGGAP